MDYFRNPHRCSDPVLYHNRAVRQRAHEERQINRRILTLFQTSLALFLWACMIALLVGAA